MAPTERARNFLVAAIVAGFGCAVGLILPWFDLGGDARSSIDLIASLGALDVIEGGLKVAVVAAWLLTPVAVSAAMLLTAAGRYRAAAWCLLPLGAAMPLLVGIVAIVDLSVLAWGAYVTAAFALSTFALAIMVLVNLASSDSDR